MKYLQQVSNKNKIIVIFVVSFILQMLFVVFAPLTQDDSWYASYSYSYLKTGHFSPLSIIPEYNDYALGITNSYFYAALQILFFKLFGVNYLAARFPSVLFGLANLFVFYKILQAKFTIKNVVAIVAVFGFGYLFLLHTWARREMAALFPILLSIYLLEKKSSNINYFFSFLLYFIAFDLHPMACALIVVYGIYKVVASKKVATYLYAFLGSVAGLGIVFLSKLIYFGGVQNFLQLFSVPKEDLEYVGDHFIPLLKIKELDFSFYFKTFYKRWWKLVILFISSFAFLILLHKDSIKNLARSKNIKFSLVLLLGYFLITTFFFSTAGNGFQLYALAPVLLLIASIYEASNSYKYLPVLANLFIIGTVTHSAFHLLNYSTKYNAFAKHKQEVKQIIATTDSVGMSPLYFFEAVQVSKSIRYVQFAQIEMAKKNIDFLQAIKEKHYTKFALDENIYPFLFKEIADTSYLYSNDFYKKVPLISKKYFDSLVNNGVLVKTDSTVSPFVGGKYLFYSIRK
jgi:hypothetical protein